MTNKFVRTLVVASLHLLLSVARLRAQALTNDPYEGMLVQDSAQGYRIYQNRPMFWPIHDIQLGAYMLQWTAPETRRLFLVAVLYGVDDEVMSPLIVTIDGTGVSLKLEDHPRIDMSGCVPIATQSVEDNDNLARRISMATRVRVVYEGRSVLLSSTLTPEDQERFRRIIALWDMNVLPPAPPPARDPGTDPRMFAPPPEGVTNPQLILSSKVTPRYPGKARAKGKSGRVILAARILKDGTVGTLRPLSISTRGCGFVEAAIEAVKQWKYTPATREGQPVETDFTIVVDFTLDKPAGRVALLDTRKDDPGGRGK